jgi:hypothetical protein
MSLLDNAVHVVPVLGRSTLDATGKIGLLLRATTTAGSVNHTIPAEVRGCWVKLLVVGANTQYAITQVGDTAPTLVYNQDVAMGTGHAAAGGTLVDGVEQQFRLPDNAQTLTVISSSTAGKLEMYVTGRTGG